MSTETAPLADEQRTQIEARANAATPGPWGWRGYDDGSVELRALHGFGPRVITTMAAPPCIDYVNGTHYLRDAESLPNEGPCGTCTDAFNDGSFLNKTVHCERTDTWDTVHVWNPDGYCEPINRYTVREQPYRADVASVTHPDAVFIENARVDVPTLLAEVERLVAIAETQSVVWWLDCDNDCADPEVFASENAAKAAAERVYRDANQIGLFEDDPEPEFDWREHRDGGTELYVDDEATGLVAHRLEVKGSTGSYSGNESAQVAS